MSEQRRIPTTGSDKLFREFSSGPGDRATLYDLQTLAMTMSLEELKRFCEGSMNALIVVQDQFRKRFPAEFAGLAHRVFAVQVRWAK